MRISPVFARSLALSCGLLAPVVFGIGCTETPAAQVDSDNDEIPDLDEDRNQNGQVDPGETDPNLADTDGDGILDEVEVGTLACGRIFDRPFAVYDMPGANSMLLMDAQVSIKSMLRTLDGKAPGGTFFDAERGVAAVLVSKRPASGVATPSAQRDFEQRNTIAMLGQITGQRTRAFTTVEGFDAEQASFQLTAASPLRADEVASVLASQLLNGVQVDGTLVAQPTMPAMEMTINLLTVYRSARRVVLVASVVAGANPTSDQLIRMEEFTDGTNVARHGSFTRHVCDEFEADDTSAADIIMVVDDSGSMEDDQQAVRDAADAMDEVLTAADVDFRLAVARMWADNENDPRRGRLEGDGFTRDIAMFKRDILVGADGGWEPGLETGILAIDSLLPPEADNPMRLREGAARIVIHLSDERDQTVECVACGGCEERESDQTFCTEAAGQDVVDRFIADYSSREIVSFALVGDLPNGCSQQGGSRDDFEPGQGYVEVANATGGQFGSLCGDMRQNLEDVARAATGVASSYQLSAVPASATIRVVIGQPGMGRQIPRNRENGFDYDPVQNKVVFYGDSRPQAGDEVVFGYRRWDWANNPSTPADPCDECEVHTQCLPTLDTVQCEPLCGEVICDPGLACLPDTAECGDPALIPPPSDCDCDAGLACDQSTLECVPPCTEVGCEQGEICNQVTQICQIPDF